MEGFLNRYGSLDSGTGGSGTGNTPQIQTVGATVGFDFDMTIIPTVANGKIVYGNSEVLADES